MIHIREFRSADRAMAWKTSVANIGMAIPHISIEAGKVYALIGKSGSGKSLLLSLLMGYPAFPFTRSTHAKSFSIFGHALTNDHFRSKHKYLSGITSAFQKGDMLYLPQHLPLCNSRKTATRMSAILTLEALTKSQVDINKLNERFQNHNLMAELDKPLRTLSGGERRRCELLVRLIAAETKKKGTVLLLDEPTTGFDQTSSLNFMREIRSEISSMTKRGIPISAIISTHNLEFLDNQYDLVDEVIVVHRDILPSSAGITTFCGVIFQGAAHDFLKKVTHLTNYADLTSMRDHKIYELLDNYPLSDWMRSTGKHNN